MTTILFVIVICLLWVAWDRLQKRVKDLEDLVLAHEERITELQQEEPQTARRLAKLYGR